MRVILTIMAVILVFSLLSESAFLSDTLGKSRFQALFHIDWASQQHFMHTTLELGMQNCQAELVNMTKFQAQLCYIKNDYPDLLTLEIGDVLYKNDVAKVTSLRATEKLQICVRNYEDTGCKVTNGARFRSKGQVPRHQGSVPAIAPPRPPIGWITR